MTEKFGDRVKFIDITAEKRLFSLPYPLAQAQISGIGDELIESIEARAHWSRYGL
jgi:hypothetical protein